MSKIRLLGKLISVEKVERQKSSTGSMFVEPQISSSAGRITNVGPDVKGLRVGEVVYYGPKVEPVRIKGADLLVMNEDNVFAVEESEHEVQT